MHIRIKELAEQAWDHLIDEMGDVVSEDGGLNSDFIHAFVQRFAELIVAEVISKAEDYGLGCDAVEQLKEDFGVEE